MPLPWMTPERRFSGSDNEEFILVWLWCVRSEKKFKSHDKNVPRIRMQFNKQSFMRDSIKSFGKIDVHDCSLKTQLYIESPIILWVKEICTCRTPFKE